MVDRLRIGQRAIQCGADLLEVVEGHEVALPDKLVQDRARDGVVKEAGVVRRDVAVGISLPDMHGYSIASRAKPQSVAKSSKSWTAAAPAVRDDRTASCVNSSRTSGRERIATSAGGSCLIMRSSAREGQRRNAATWSLNTTCNTRDRRRASAVKIWFDRIMPSIARGSARGPTPLTIAAEIDSITE